MRRKRMQSGICLFAAAYTTVFLFTVTGIHQADAQYVIRNSVIASGCGSLTNTEYRLVGTVGQPVIGAMTGGGSPTYGTTVGFWYAQHSLLTRVPGDRQLPTEFRLDQNYPNPFNPVTTINYQLPVESSVGLMLYDVLGRQIAVLVSATLQAGYYMIRWDGTNCASGIYYARFTATDAAGNLRYVKVSKLMLVR
jgi:hypothetical protein